MTGPLAYLSYAVAKIDCAIGEFRKRRKNTAKKAFSCRLEGALARRREALACADRSRCRSCVERAAFEKQGASVSA